MREKRMTNEKSKWDVSYQTDVKPLGACTDITLRGIRKQIYMESLM